MEMNGVREALSVLVGQPLVQVFRALDMVCLEFGEMVEKDVFVRGAQGNLVVGRGMAGRYALHAQGMCRMVCGGAVRFARGDMFQAGEAALAAIGVGPDDDVPEDFDVMEPGNSRLDAVLAGAFAEGDGLVVEAVRVGALGDLRVVFGGGHVFEAFVDVAGPEECWRFFEAGTGGAHWVMTGEGLAEEEEGEGL